MENIFQEYGVGIVSGLLLLLIFIALLAYSGLFVHIKVMMYRKPVGRLRVAYLYATGPYKDCGPLFGRVSRHAPHHRTLGIYYDDTETTAASKLRYLVAAVLSEDDALESDDGLVEERLVKDGFRITEFPAIQRAVGTEFPFPWFISIFIAIFRVYPKLHRVIKKEGLHVGPCLELYESAKIRFILPLTDHDAFFVPEFHRA
ncbi:testis-expressed protein 264-like [Diadema antillarum]|uniref:testis-expressed protein 264-like n=1 Tax=Diadema antillarum TaxID=105358 RepID=UPI003A85FE56